MSASSQHPHAAHLHLAPDTEPEPGTAAAGILDLERCRQILGPDCSLSDEEITRLVEELSLFASVLIDVFLQERARKRRCSGRG